MSLGAGAVHLHSLAGRYAQGAPDRPDKPMTFPRSHGSCTTNCREYVLGFGVAGEGYRYGVDATWRSRRVSCST
jgi:hypothetical protein